MSVPFRRTRRFRTLIALFLLGAAGFGLLAAGVQWSEPLLRIDHNVADRLHEHARASPGFVRFFLALTWLGTFWALTTLSVVAIVAMWQFGHGRLALAWAIVLIGSGLLIDGIKKVVDRERPV